MAGSEGVSEDKPRFVHCGCCECYHPVAFAGDCRDDANRFAAGDLDDRYGFDGWEEVGPDSDVEQEASA